MGALDVPPLHPRQVAQFTGHEVLFDDDFSDGLQGWSGLRDAGINRFPTLHPYASTGQNSMFLEVADGVGNAIASASKRTSYRAGRYRWYSRVGWSSDSGAGGMRYLRWSMDQEDATDRYWVDLRYTNYDTDPEVNGINPKWEVNVGAGGEGLVYEDIGLDYELGFNQKNKVDFADITLEVDFSGATKRYVSLRVNDVTVDLTDYTLAPGAKIDPPGTYFTNGQNFLFWVQNLPNANTTPSMFIDRTRAEVLP
jgi:hypothetical protein